MEILNNFSSIQCFITFVIGAVFMLATLSIAAICNDKKPKNKVHFYIARDKNGKLYLYMGKPFRDSSKFCSSLSNHSIILDNRYFNWFKLNEDDYNNLKWEDEPVEVFLNLED